jgi:hypothetical protein
MYFKVVSKIFIKFKKVYPLMYSIKTSISQLANTEVHNIP